LAAHPRGDGLTIDAATGVGRAAEEAAVERAKALVPLFDELTDSPPARLQAS